MVERGRLSEQVENAPHALEHRKREDGEERDDSGVERMQTLGGRILDGCPENGALGKQGHQQQDGDSA